MAKPLRATRYNRKLGLRAQFTMAVPCAYDLAIDVVMGYANDPPARVPFNPVNGTRPFLELRLVPKGTSLKDDNIGMCR